jgi:hypothetical protein
MYLFFLSPELFLSPGPPAENTHRNRRGERLGARSAADIAEALTETIWALTSTKHV